MGEVPLAFFMQIRGITMFELSSFLFFLSASMLLIIAPGPDLLFAITQGISNGRRAGVATGMGLALGNSIHTLAAAFGISLIFKTSAIAFTVLKILGAAYLLFLAFKAIKNRNSMFTLKDEKPASERALLARGFLMNVLNPKVALFFLAFLPQFVNPAIGNVPLQMIILGLIFMVLTAIIFGTIGYFSGFFGQWLVQKPAASRYISYGSASVFVALAVKLALTER